MTPRRLAAKIVVRVLRDDAYASATLSSGLARSGFEGRDRALTTEIVYGVVRTYPYLARRLGALGRLKESDHDLLAQLYVAAYQIEFLDRVPARAAIFEAVEAISELRGKKVGGFANAILRALSQDRTQRLDLMQATLSSTPSWLRKRLVRDVGESAMMALLAPPRAPRPFLRVQAGPEEVSWLENDCSPCEGVPGAFEFVAGGDPRSRPEFEAGKFVVQELGAQLVAHAMGVRPGERVLDACAGRGQKATLLARSVGPEGRIVASDLHAYKLTQLADEAARLGVTVSAQPWDWTRTPPAPWVDHFDRVLVDAPCSGVGTLRRRPEIARRLGAEDPARLAELQFEIAKNAARAVRPGGWLVFATCSVLREEAEGVVTRIEEELPQFREECPTTEVDAVLFPTPALELTAAADGLPPDPEAALNGAAGGGHARAAHFRLLPNVHGTEGYFVARLRRA